MINLSKRTETFTESVIRYMTRVCINANAINLSQGFPDFDPPKALLESLATVAYKGPHQYSITSGSNAIREALSRKIKHFSNLDYDKDSQICVTCGSTEAMMAAVLATINPGDKVAIFSPFYENYGADCILGSASPIYIPLINDNFAIDYEKLEDAFRLGAKALILCNPSNPCGKVFTKEELTNIAYIIKKYNAFVITDEVYEHILYKPHTHTYMAAINGMYERTIICNSLSKTYSITGWRLGYVAGPKEVIDRVKKVHDFLTVGAAAPLQEAVVTALNFDDNYYEDLQEKYTHKRELFINGLDNLNLKHNSVEGAYYVLIDISEFGYKKDTDFCLDLANKIKVGAVPGSCFFKDDCQKYIRLHFAKKDETLINALNNLEKIKSLLK